MKFATFAFSLFLATGAVATDSAEQCHSVTKVGNDGIPVSHLEGACPTKPSGRRLRSLAEKPSSEIAHQTDRQLILHSLFATKKEFKDAFAECLIDTFDSANYKEEQSDEEMNAESVTGAKFEATLYVGLEVNLGGLLGLTAEVNANLVFYDFDRQSHVYCCGCNGSWLLDLTSVNFGNPGPVYGVGLTIVKNAKFWAYVTFGDDTTANVELSTGVDVDLDVFWNIHDERGIKTIHFGLKDGLPSDDGEFIIADLYIGSTLLDGVLEVDAGIDAEVLGIDADVDAKIVIFDSDYKTGTGGGDPHFKTWTNEWYDFHGECDMVFLKNPAFSSGAGMDISIRTTRRYQYSFIESAALRIGTDILEVSGHGQYIINSVGQATLPNSLNGFTVNTYETNNAMKFKYAVDLGGESSIVIETFKDMVSIKLVDATPDLFGESAGLMGDYATGEWIGRNGTIIGAADDFGNEWQVRDTEANLFMTAREPQWPAKCIMPGVSKESRRLGASSISKEAAETACAHWGVQKGMCVFDVMATNDLEVAENGPWF